MYGITPQQLRETRGRDLLEMLQDLTTREMIEKIQAQKEKLK